MKQKEKVNNKFEKTSNSSNSNSELNFTSKKSLSICNMQNLYDMTNIKNGLHINEVADLICKMKKIKIISDDIFIDQCKDFSLHLQTFGLNTSLYSLNDDLKIEESDAILILTEDVNKYKSILVNSPKKVLLNTVGVLSEKDKLNEIQQGYVLYFLDNAIFDKMLSVNAILNCIGINILVCLNHI